MKDKTIDEYLAAVDEAKCEALQSLRRQILAAAPGAKECISYDLPAFRQTRIVCGLGASRNDCAFYMLNNSTLDAFDGDLSGYDVSKGTIQFQPRKPLPSTLIHKLVKARLTENTAASKKD